MNDELLNELINAIVSLSKEDSLWKIWAPAISTVFGALLTGISAFFAVSWQINKNHTYSNRMFLNTKKEDLYIYLDIIKNEIINEYKTLQHYDPENEPSDASNIRESIRKKLLHNMTEQKTKNKINMVISLYLQDVDIFKLKFNTLYDEFSHECKECYSTVVDFNFPYQKLNLSKLTKTKNKLITAIQQMQNKVIDIKR